MDHKVRAVGQLYDDAKALYTEVCCGGADSSAESIINNLNAGIENLKNCWEGKDAGKQIQNIVFVHNAMVTIYNALAGLASSATAVASNYREIQNVNGAGLETLVPITTDVKTIVPDYSDDRDTINITSEANTGKEKIDLAASSLPEFINEVKKHYELIMDNWTVGTGRDAAQSAFDEFLTNSQTYNGKLTEVSNSIATAISNYAF